uniref:Uncharacterized protein n=1 Tax=Rhodnius prolixus TaxID=13249 RepID=T1H928_RHOPR
MEARYCIEECVYKGMGLLDESGTALNHQRLTQELNRAVTGAGLWESAMQQAITSCSGATGVYLFFFFKKKKYYISYLK